MRTECDRLMAFSARRAGIVQGTDWVRQATYVDLHPSEPSDIKSLNSGKNAMQEKADTRKLKVYCETTVIGDMTSRPSPLIRNLARQMITREWCIMETNERDTLEEVYEVKRSISSSFETYEQFAEWLMSEQEAAKKDGVKFIAA